MYHTYYEIILVCLWYLLAYGPVNNYYQSNNLRSSIFTLVNPMMGVTKTKTED